MQSYKRRSIYVHCLFYKIPGFAFMLLTEVITLQGGDAHAGLKGLEGGAGFLLTSNRGYIYDLEGYCYDGAWPNDIEIIGLSYANGPHRNEDEVINSFDPCDPID